MNKANMSKRNTRKGRASMAAISALLAMLGVATLSPQASSVMPMLRRVLSLEENYGVELPDGMQMVSSRLVTCMPQMLNTLHNSLTFIFSLVLCHLLHTGLGAG